ncbi:MAG TPA: TonB-dependent receptor [Longimicrobiales bacterium]|nr:TonB-dependent receptor [Longimicrobiales bacterium]
MPLRAQCPADQATLFETVTERTTRVPLAGATISASWHDQIDRTQQVRADSAGRATICAPAGIPVTVRAAYRKMNSAPQTAMLTLARSTSQVINVDAPLMLVRGTIVDDQTNQPITNVSLRIGNTALASVTDNTGTFMFASVPVGDYKLRVEHISYALYETALSINSHDLNAAIRLAPSAIPLQPIIVTAFSRRLDNTGFYERQKRGVGKFLSRNELESYNGQFGSDLLRSVPSLRQIPSTQRRNSPRNYTPGRGNCRFRFLLDGSRTMPDFEMDNVPPYTIEGIEIYNGLSEVPAIFRQVIDAGGGATCGVIAIWTRDGR